MQLLHPLNSCCTIYVLDETRVLKCGYNSVSQLLHVPAVCHKAELAAQLKQLESSQHNSFLSTFYLTFFKAVASKFQEHLWDEWQQLSLFVGGAWPVHSHPYGCSAFSWPETNCYKGPDPH